MNGLKAVCVGGALLASMSAADVNALTVTVALGAATSFQDEGTTTGDVTAKLADVDGVWAPNLAGTVVKNFYATGSSVRHFDGVSLGFDLGGVGFDNIASATLRFYTQMGDYVDTSWHHYKVLPGAQNSANEDDNVDVAAPPPPSFGSQLRANQTVGWVDAAIDASWITSNSLDLTLRLWNARIDGVELLVDTKGTEPSAPVPEPGTMLLLGTGLVGFASALRGKKKA